MCARACPSCADAGNAPHYFYNRFLTSDQLSGAPVEPSELEPSKPAEFAEQVAAAAPEVPAAFLQAEPRATDELPCDLPTIIGDYAGAPPNRVPSRSAG